MSVFSSSCLSGLSSESLFQALSQMHSYHYQSILTTKYHISSDVLPAHSLMSSLVSRLICLVMIVRNLLSLNQLSALTNEKTVEDNVSQSEALS